MLDVLKLAKKTILQKRCKYKKDVIAQEAVFAAFLIRIVITVSSRSKQPS